MTRSQDSSQGSSLDLYVITGTTAAHKADAIWEMLDARRRRMLFWDIPAERRKNFLARALSIADVVGLAAVNGEPAGLSWVFREGDSGVIHMTYWQDGDSARHIGGHFLERLAELGYRSLLAVLPVPFRHIRRYVADIGFRRVGLLPGGAPLADRGRVADAELWMWIPSNSKTREVAQWAQPWQHR